MTLKAAVNGIKHPNSIITEYVTSQSKEKRKPSSLTCITFSVTTTGWKKCTSPFSFPRYYLTPRLSPVGKLGYYLESTNCSSFADITTITIIFKILSHFCLHSKTHSLAKWLCKPCTRLHLPGTLQGSTHWIPNSGIIWSNIQIYDLYWRTYLAVDFRYYRSSPQVYLKYDSIFQCC